jgi:hypothetical protein
MTVLKNKGCTEEAWNFVCTLPNERNFIKRHGGRSYIGKVTKRSHGYRAIGSTSKHNEWSGQESDSIPSAHAVQKKVPSALQEKETLLCSR